MGVKGLNDNNHCVLHFAPRDNPVGGGERRHHFILGMSTEFTGQQFYAAGILDDKLDSIGELASDAAAGGARGGGRERNQCARCKSRLIRVVFMLHDGVDVDIDATVKHALVPVGARSKVRASVKVQGGA